MVNSTRRKRNISVARGNRGAFVFVSSMKQKAFPKRPLRITIWFTRGYLPFSLSRNAPSPPPRSWLDASLGPADALNTGFKSLRRPPAAPFPSVLASSPRDGEEKKWPWPITITRRQFVGDFAERRRILVSGRALGRVPRRHTHGNASSSLARPSVAVNRIELQRSL